MAHCNGKAGWQARGHLIPVGLTVHLAEAVTLEVVKQGMAKEFQRTNRKPRAIKSPSRSSVARPAARDSTTTPKGRRRQGRKDSLTSQSLK